MTDEEKREFLYSLSGNGWCDMCSNERPCECDEQLLDDMFGSDIEEFDSE